MKKAKKMIQNLLATLESNVKKELEKLELLKKEVNTSEKLLNGEKKNYDRGNLSLQELIDTQNLLTNSQSNYIAQKVNYIKAIVEWKRVTDSLVEKL